MDDIKVKAAERFCSSEHWGTAVWLATTYRCHPNGEAPPVMGLVFANHENGLALFTAWTDEWGNNDQEDAIRIVIIEGKIPGQIDGYSIRISADDLDAGTGQIIRVYPSPETKKGFEQFKAQYLHHGEFLLCPVIQKQDGQLWFNAHAGIIKKKIYFRNADDIDENDQDVVILKPVESETALHILMEAVNQQPREISEEQDS